MLNEGRQKLYGNVGFRLIEANAQGLINAPGAGGRELVLVRLRV